MLDIGCSNGQHTIKAAKHVKKIIGIDVDTQELEKAKREAARKRIKNIKFEKASAEEKLKFKSESFDKILFLDVLEHLHNQDLALSEVRRILKQKGILLLAVPNKNTSWKKLQKSVGLSYFSDPDHKREYSKTEIEGLLKKHKFNVVSNSPIVYDTFLTPIFDLIGGFSLKLYYHLQKWKAKKAIENSNESTGFEIVAEEINDLARQD
jgi:ubiquinone/menaquinone biosynthesis C-methylase UbiE